MKIIPSVPLAVTKTIGSIQMLAAFYNFADQSITFTVQPLDQDGYGTFDRQVIQLSSTEVQTFFSTPVVAGETCYDVFKRAFLTSIAVQYSMQNPTVT